LTPKRRSWAPTYRHVRAQVFMAKRDAASRTGWLTHRLKRTGMSIAAQYRVHAAEFLSLACKMNDSCQTSELINKALYWFNMAERGETQISESPTEVDLPPNVAQKTESRFSGVATAEPLHNANTGEGHGLFAGPQRTNPS